MTASSEPPLGDDFDVKLDAQSLKTASVRGAVAIGLSQLIKLVLQIGSQIALARLLFPQDFGLLAIVYPVVNFAAIFSDIGFGEAVVQREKLDQGRVSALFWTSLGLSCGLAALSATLSPLVATIYKDARISALLCVASLGLPIGALGGVQGALLTRYMLFTRIVRIEIAGAIIGAAATIGGAWLGWGYWSLAIGSLTGQSAGALMSWVASRWRPSRPRWSKSFFDDLKFGGNVTGYNLASFLIQSGDNVIVGLRNGQYALGLYDRSYRLVVQPIGQVLAPIGRVAIPLLSRLANVEDEFRRTYITIVRVILLLACPGMVVCVVFAPEIVGILLGPRWSAAGPVFRWIAVAGVTGPLQAPALWLFISQARMSSLRTFTLMTSALNLIAFFVGSFWGVYGVAVANAAVCTLVTTPLTVHGATRNPVIRMNDVLRCVVPIWLTAVVTGIILFELRQLGSSRPGIISIVIASIAAYALFLLIGLRRKEERRSLKLFIRRMKSSG